MRTMLYKPFSLLVSMLGGMLAGALFKRIWRLAAHEEQPPSATDESRRWPEILGAAALEGAIFAVVKAALHRGMATTARQVTGTWPAAEQGAREPESKEHD